MGLLSLDNYQNTVGREFLVCTTCTWEKYLYTTFRSSYPVTRYVMHHYCGYWYLLVNSAYHQVAMAIYHGSGHAGGYGHNLIGRCSKGTLVTIVVIQRIL